MSGINFTVMFIDAAVAVYLINGWAALGAGPKAALNLLLALVCLWLWQGSDTASASIIARLAR